MTRLRYEVYCNHGTDGDLIATSRSRMEAMSIFDRESDRDHFSYSCCDYWDNDRSFNWKTLDREGCEKALTIELIEIEEEQEEDNPDRWLQTDESIDRMCSGESILAEKTMELKEARKIQSSYQRVEDGDAVAFFDNEEDAMASMANEAKKLIGQGFDPEEVDLRIDQTTKIGNHSRIIAIY